MACVMRPFVAAPDRMTSSVNGIDLHSGVDPHPMAYRRRSTRGDTIRRPAVLFDVAAGDSASSVYLSTALMSSRFAGRPRTASARRRGERARRFALAVLADQVHASFIAAAISGKPVDADSVALAPRQRARESRGSAEGNVRERANVVGSLGQVVVRLSSASAFAHAGMARAP